MSPITFLSVTLLLLASASQSHQYCPSIEPPEYGFVKIDVRFPYYEFSCEDGYRLQGKTFVNCNVHDLEKVIPRCIKHACEDPPSPQNGEVKCDEGPLVPGKTCRFSCFNGYKLQGASTALCKFNLQWSRSAECISIQTDSDECTNDLECSVDQICALGKCIKGCRNDENCKFEEACINHICHNPCSVHGACGHNALCKAINHDGVCTCLPGYTGNPHTLCTKRISTSSIEICESPSPPENGVVECEKGDFTLGKTCRFGCFEEYKLQGVEVTRCMSQNRWSGRVKCVPLREYAYSEPADDNRRVPQNIGVSNSHQLTKNDNSLSEVTISDTCKNLSCQQLCWKQNGKHRCRCCAGYILNTDKRTCRLKNPQRVNMTACLHQFGKVGDVELRSCARGYIFDYERNDCIEDSRQLLPVQSTSTPFKRCPVGDGGCQHACTTTITSETYKCICQVGYELHRDGKHCIDIDECSMDNFGCVHFCYNLPGRATCGCEKGFTLQTDGKNCIDVDECSIENRCEHFCNNTPGSYVCSCKPSYILIEGYKCEGCRRNSYWSYERNACVDCPRNSHTDSEGKTSIKDCKCNSGYTGSPGDYVTCEDIHECSVENFGCSHECVNIPGSAYCICPKGFILDTDNKTCIDIDECSIKNGGCKGLCINTNGSFDCVCPDGFTASNKDRYSCDDIDECLENNGGCEHLCINYLGGFYCACESGYHLDSSLKKCADIQCPKLALPHYSYMECTYRNASLPEKNSYPVGTLCSFRCNKGFKNTESGNKMKCKRDRKWEGILPECKPQSCPPLKVPENGELHPSSCSIQGAKVKQKCTFSCHPGYILNGFPVFNCKNNLEWSKEDIPACELVKIQPVIKCPADIQVTLSRGEATQNITIPEPSTNMESYEVHPSSVTVNEQNEFSVGTTQITFIANSSFNETAQCGMTVTVLDEEPPIFHSCPDPITIEGAKGSGEFVTWDEPIVTDNVELVSAFSILEPNTTLAPGTYFVEYVARDSSGNIATCSFEISIIRMNCSNLGDPVHGKANCMDWMFGKLCNPECEDGYMRDPNDPLYYSCDDTGLWEPSDSISECLQCTLATSSTCEDGFELQKVDVSGEEFCIECPSNAVWSSITRTCVK